MSYKKQTFFTLNIFKRGVNKKTAGACGPGGLIKLVTSGNLFLGFVFLLRLLDGGAENIAERSA